MEDSETEFLHFPFMLSSTYSSRRRHRLGAILSGFADIFLSESRLTFLWTLILYCILSFANHPSCLLQIAFCKLSDRAIRGSLPDCIELPLSVVAIYLAKQHCGLVGIIIRQIVNAHLLVVSCIHKADKCISPHKY